MAYFLLKILHVLIAAVLLGIAWGGSIQIFWVKSQRNLALLYLSAKKMAFLSLAVVLPGFLAQMLLGFSIAGLREYSLHEPWLQGVFLAFTILVMVWLVGTLSLLRFADNYDERCYRLWCWCMAASSFLFLVMLFLMANKP